MSNLRFMAPAQASEEVDRLNSNCKSADEDTRLGKQDTGSGDRGTAVVAHDQTPATLAPGVGALDDPAFWQRDETGAHGLGGLVGVN